MPIPRLGARTRPLCYTDADLQDAELWHRPQDVAEVRALPPRNPFRSILVEEPRILEIDRHEFCRGNSRDALLDLLRAADATWIGFGTAAHGLLAEPGLEPEWLRTLEFARIPFRNVKTLYHAKLPNCAARAEMRTTRVQFIVAEHSPHPIEDDS